MKRHNIKLSLICHNSSVTTAVSRQQCHDSSVTTSFTTAVSQQVSQQQCHNSKYVIFSGEIFKRFEVL